jgi:signal transduction histidine kinase
VSAQRTTRAGLRRLPAPQWAERLWAIVGTVGIRAKILGIVLGLVALMGMSATLEVRQILSGTLDAQLHERSVSVTRDLAARATDLLLTNDLYALNQLLRDTQANNADVRYAFLVGPDGQVIAHTFGAGLPAELLEANRAGADAHHHSVKLTTDEGLVWDTAVPIFDGRAGTARVGLSLTSLERTITSVTGQLLLTTVMVAAIGITAAALLTWVLTRPILRLVELAQAVARGDFSQRAQRWAGDEIGTLTDAFNAMSASLAGAEQERAGREQLRAQYVSGVIAAQEDERKRIARELHDSTSQSLTSLLIGLRALADRAGTPEVQRQVEDLRGVVGHTLEELHALARQLRPSVLDDLGLAEAIARYVADCRSRAGLGIDLALTGLAGRRLPPEVETALYRIVQEALTNVVRHAGARTASICVEQRPHSVRAIIEDDGCGFEPASIPADGHLGVHGIRERAELLGGTLIIESEPGHGTSLFVELPLTEKASGLHHSISAAPTAAPTREM